MLRNGPIIFSKQGSQQDLVVACSFDLYFSMEFWRGFRYWGSSRDVTLGAATSHTKLSRCLPCNFLIKKYKLTLHEPLFSLINFINDLSMLA